MKIIDIRHPDYDLVSWEKWRYTYEGGDTFIEKYLKQYSDRETSTDFAKRKEITYLPAFAKGAVEDIKNAIFQRTVDVIRKGGSNKYRQTIEGNLNGIDLEGSSMNEFIGQAILPELLSMSKVGVFVDMPKIETNSTIKEVGDKHPYIYTYRAEDILSWNYTDKVLDNVLLRDNYYEKVDGLPVAVAYRYRHITLTEEGVMVNFYDDDGEIIDEKVLDISAIPFVIIDIQQSLLKEVSNHQIALLNMSSSDVHYAVKANFPFYTEQFDPRSTLPHLEKKKMSNGEIVTSDKNIEIGTIKGRRYPLNTDRPGFVHPSSEPLSISMKKQEEIKVEIRTLVSLAVSNLNPKMASAESKSYDMRGLEAGLSYIGLVLQKGERQIANFWNMYTNEEEIIIKYPEKYSLKSDEEKRKDALDLKKIMGTIPSQRFRIEVAKEIARITVGAKIGVAEMLEIESQIDDSKIIVIDNKELIEDIQEGLVTRKSASVAKGYPETEWEQAKTEHIDRLKRIQEAQTAKNPEGVPDLTDNPKLNKINKNRRGDGNGTE